MKTQILALLLTLTLLLVGCGVYEGPGLPSAEPGWEETEVPSLSAQPDHLLVRFLDVGQGDSTLLENQGHFILIDGGVREEGPQVVEALEGWGVERLDAIICTHGHEDHVGGLSDVLTRFPASAIYAPAGNEDAGSFAYFTRKAAKQGLSVVTPALGDVIPLGAAEILVLGPVDAYEGLNDTSLILRVDFGENSFLFVGDMEAQAEGDLLDHWADRPELLDVDILKVGHHGSSDSSGYRFLYQVTADYGVISCGENNDYGHPHAEAMERLDCAGVTVLRTDQLGTVTADCNGVDVDFSWSDPSGQPDYPDRPQEEQYIGNARSHNFHSPLCDGLPSQRNRVEFDSYQEALAEGYLPCTNCLDPAAEWDQAA